MASLDELKKAATDFHRSQNDAQKYKAQIANADGLPPNKIRVYVPALRNTKIVNSVISQPGTWVWIELMPDGEYQVTDVAIPDSTPLFQDALPEVIQPRGMGGRNQYSIDSNGFVPGRLEPSQKGGLWLHVRNFKYDGGYYDGDDLDAAIVRNQASDPTLSDIDVSSLVPATVNYACWVLVYFDRSDAALHTLASTAIFDPTSGTLLSIASIGDVAVPLNVYPVGAVTLANGQTDWSATSRFIDYRLFLDVTRPRNNYDATGAPTVTDDETEGYRVGSVWIDGSDIYDCTDATTGAAVWTLRGLGGGGSVGTWANSNVTWKSGTNAVTLDAASQQRYIIVGKLVTLAIYLKAGSAAASSGTINISGLPAPIAGTFSGDAHVLGAAQVRDQGVAFYNAVVTAFDTDTLHFWVATTLLAFKIDTSPQDEISFTIQYETP